MGGWKSWLRAKAVEPLLAAVPAARISVAIEMARRACDPDTGSEQRWHAGRSLFDLLQRELPWTKDDLLDLLEILRDGEPTLPELWAAVTDLLERHGAALGVAHRRVLLEICRKLPPQSFPGDSRKAVVRLMWIAGASRLPIERTEPWAERAHDDVEAMAPEQRDAWTALSLVQPFRQAHREVYLLTDAERATGTYSNRFAAHIVKQHQFHALCGVRGWKDSLRLMVDQEFPPPSRELPAWGMRAELWVDGIGDDSHLDVNDVGVYLRIATDQVRFYRIDAATHLAHGGVGGYRTDGPPPEPVRLEDVPPLVFSEVMRDVDLFVGVASVGNDPTWVDGGPEGRYLDYWTRYAFGELSATARTRRELLERLIPRLKIADRCSLSGRFLRVRGDLHTYLIHLGSANIQIEPQNRYLCIVPGRGAVTGPASKLFLPFEGDRTLSIILSKAFLLANDKNIRDPAIRSQLRE